MKYFLPHIFMKVTTPWALFMGLGLLLPILVILHLIPSKAMIGYMLFVAYAGVRLINLAWNFSRWKHYMPYAASLFIFVLFIYFSAPITSLGKKFWVWSDPRFEECKQKAKPVTAVGALGICTSSYHDDGIWYTDLPYREEIIYDSTDEIMLPASQRSLAWQSAFTATHSHISPEMSYVVTRIAEHFYWVTFSI